MGEEYYIKTCTLNHGTCIRPFSIIITKYQRLGTYKKKRFILLIVLGTDSTEMLSAGLELWLSG